ncbi:MAG: hypothetical protein WCY12_03250 [Candidatus Omnitrophota bacterium]
MKKQNIALILAFSVFLTCGSGVCLAQVQEAILYDITLIGSSEYKDLGVVELFGKKVDFVVFHTKVAGFDDTERIYSDPVSGLPIRVEREIAMWLHKEKITEEYFPELNKVVITKFESGKKVEEISLNAKGPIQNAILMPFSLRKVSSLDIGWSTRIRLPEEFKVTIDKIEEVSVGAGKFKAYHFISDPKKFEIWISCDDLRIPVKITGFGAFSYTMAMKKHTLGEKAQ